MSRELDIVFFFNIIFLLIKKKYLLVELIVSELSVEPCLEL